MRRRRNGRGWNDCCTPNEHETRERQFESNQNSSTTPEELLQLPVFINHSESRSCSITLNGCGAVDGPFGSRNKTGLLCKNKSNNDLVPAPKNVLRKWPRQSQNVQKPPSSSEIYSIVSCLKSKYYETSQGRKIEPIAAENHPIRILLM